MSTMDLGGLGENQDGGAFESSRLVLITKGAEI